VTWDNGVAYNETMAEPVERASPVIAVERALRIMEAFKAGEKELALAELARRTRLHKTTVLRIARTLGESRYLVRAASGAWRLGPAAGALGTRYHRGFDDAVVIEPVLRDLARKTRESAAFYVREANMRVCVVRVDGPQPTRYHAQLGEILPLDSGAAGRVLLAYAGEPGEPYESIRRAGYHMTFGERDPAVASLAAAVFGHNHVLAGAVAVTGPLERFTPAAATRHVRSVSKAAARLTDELGGNVRTVRQADRRPNAASR
jgi:DNA-binding IclR family transcriptional regulator